MTLWLGIDGGGTHCRARIAGADGRALGEAVSGPANTRLGLDAVFGEIVSACETALDAAGLPRGRIADLRAGLGLAGLMLKSERDKVMARPHPFATLTAVNDTHVACLGAHAGRDGAVLIVGTGSGGCALIDGAERTVGGWGFEIGDRGSGAWIGHAAVGRSLWAFEGLGPPSRLADVVMARFGDDPQALVAWGAAARPRDFGSLAPEVFSHAATGDALAREIVAEAAEAVAAMARRLVSGPDGALPLVLLGGVAEALRPYLPQDVTARLKPPAGDALDGALRLAGCPFTG